MKKTTAVLLVCFASLLTGCASTETYKDYTIAYNSYLEKSQKTASNKLVEFEAVDGQPITITAKSFVVYAPAGGQTDSIRPPEQAKSSEWTGTMDKLIAGAVTIGTGWISGSTMKSVVNAVAANAGHNTQTTSTATTTTSTTDSHNATTDSHNTSTTSAVDSHNTTTDSHNTDSHNTDSHNTDNHQTGIVPTGTITVTP